jgi:hypothetical protein
MLPTEAAQLAPTPAEVAANAALNLGSVSGGPAPGQEGLVLHARRMSGGGSMKMVSNLKAIEEEGDKPVHVIQTDTAVTEVYGHGLTIIRATDSVKKVGVWGSFWSSRCCYKIFGQAVNAIRISWSQLCAVLCCADVRSAEWR